MLFHNPYAKKTQSHITKDESHPSLRAPTLNHLRNISQLRLSLSLSRDTAESQTDREKQYGPTVEAVKGRNVYLQRKLYQLERGYLNAAYLNLVLLTW